MTALTPQVHKRIVLYLSILRRRSAVSNTTSFNTTSSVFGTVHFLTSSIFFNFQMEKEVVSQDFPRKVPLLVLQHFSSKYEVIFPVHYLAKTFA